MMPKYLVSGDKTNDHCNSFQLCCNLCSQLRCLWKDLIPCIWITSNCLRSVCFFLQNFEKEVAYELIFVPFNVTFRVVLSPSCLLVVIIEVTRTCSWVKIKQSFVRTNNGPLFIHVYVGSRVKVHTFMSCWFTYGNIGQNYRPWSWM